MHFDLVGVWLPDVEHVHLRQTALDFPESKGFVKEDALQPIEGSVVGMVSVSYTHLDVYKRQRYYAGGRHGPSSKPPE